MRANRARHFLAATLLLFATAPGRGVEFFTNRLDLIYAEFQHGSDQALILQIDDAPRLPGKFMQRRIPSPPLADILNEMDSAEFRTSVAQALTNSGWPVPVPAYRVLGTGAGTSPREQHASPAVAIRGAARHRGRGR